MRVLFVSNDFKLCDRVYDNVKDLALEVDFSKHILSSYDLYIFDCNLKKEINKLKAFKKPYFILDNNKKKFIYNNDFKLDNSLKEYWKAFLIVHKDKIKCERIKIHKILEEFGFKVGNLSFRYLAYLLYNIDFKRSTYNFENFIYPHLAKTFGKSVNSIKQSLYRDIDNILNRMPYEKYEELVEDIIFDQGVKAFVISLYVYINK